MTPGAQEEAVYYIASQKAHNFYSIIFTGSPFLQHHAAKVASPSSSASFDSANLHNAHLAMRQILCILFCWIKIQDCRGSISQHVVPRVVPVAHGSTLCFYTLTNKFTQIQYINKHVQYALYTLKYINIYI